MKKILFVLVVLAIVFASCTQKPGIVKGRLNYENQCDWRVKNASLAKILFIKENPDTLKSFLNILECKNKFNDLERIMINSKDDYKIDKSYPDLTTKKNLADELSRYKSDTNEYNQFKDSLKNTPIYKYIAQDSLFYNLQNQAMHFISKFGDKRDARDEEATSDMSGFYEKPLTAGKYYIIYYTDYNHIDNGNDARKFLCWALDSVNVLPGKIVHLSYVISKYSQITQYKTIDEL